MDQLLEKIKYFNYHFVYQSGVNPMVSYNKNEMDTTTGNNINIDKYTEIVNEQFNRILDYILDYIDDYLE